MADIDGVKEIELMFNTLAEGMQDRSVIAGFVEGKDYSDGTPVPMVAAIQNFGTDKIPPRPFMTLAVDHNENEWMTELQNLIAAGTPVDIALKSIGQMMQSDIKDEIQSLQVPPLAHLTMMIRKLKKERNLVGTPTTVAQLTEAHHRLAEGEHDFTGVSDKPLIDGGLMLRSVEFEVK